MKVIMLAVLLCPQWPIEPEYRYCPAWGATIAKIRTIEI